MRCQDCVRVLYLASAVVLLTLAVKNVATEEPLRMLLGFAFAYGGGASLLFTRGHSRR